MVLLATLDLDGPVELFEEYDPGEGVGKRDPAKRPHLVRPAEELAGEPQRAAEEQGEVAPAGDAEGGKPSREVFGRDPFSPLAVQRDQVGAGGDAFRNTVPFGGEDFLRGAAVHVFFADFDDLDREVAAETSSVVGAAVSGPALELADSDDGGPPDHSMPKSWPAASPRASPRA